jgi:Protein of unknown function DUF262
MTLDQLMEGVHAGRLVLPDFQRDFVWLERDVRSLIATVLRGWPAGALLFIDGSAGTFRTRPFDFTTGHTETPDYIVLDGQQRLSALFQAFYDVGPYRYFVNLDELRGNSLDDVDDALVAIKRGSKRRPPGTLVPLSALSAPDHFYRWQDEILADRRLDKDETFELLTVTYREVLSGLYNYEFPCVVLDSSSEPYAMARIFEQVNRTGIQLSAFDLVVARAYGEEWNLRDQWDEVRLGDATIERFLVVDGMPILQSIALRRLGDVRQRAVLNMPPQIVREDWFTAAAAVGESLRFLVNSCGVLDPSWLPYRPFLTILAALESDEDLATDADRFRRWFFTSAFNLAFDVAANTRTVEEFRRLRDRRSDTTVLPAEREVLFEATRQRHSAAFRGLLCAFATRQPVDIVSGETLIESTVDDSVLSPTAVVGSVLRPEDADDERVHLRALAALLTTRATAAALRHRSFELVLAEAVDNRGVEAVDDALRRQFLPGCEYLLEGKVDWRGFMTARLDILAAYLREEFGQAILEQQPV